jgi:hypothetical protein
VGAALAQHGYTPVLCTQTFGGVHEDDYVRMLLDRQVAGIVFISGLHANVDADPARYSALLERGLPIVLVNGELPGVEAPSVSNDDAASVDLAVGHLASLGHRRIGLAIGPRRYVPVLRKLAAFPRRGPPPAGGAARARGRSAGRVHALHGRGRDGRRGGAAGRRLHRDRLRVRPDGARGRPGRPRARAAGARRTCPWSAATTACSSATPTRRSRPFASRCWP